MFHLLSLPRVLVVVLLGCLSNVYARMKARWHEALPRNHADIARERHDRRCEL